MNNQPRIRYIVPAAAAILLTFGRDDWLAFIPLHTPLDLAMNLFVVVIASIFALKDITYLLSHNILLRLLFLMLALWVAIVVFLGTPFKYWPSGTNFLTLILIIVIVSQISRFELRRLRHFVLILAGIFTFYALAFGRNTIDLILSGKLASQLGEKISSSILVAYPRIMYVIIITCLFSLIVEKRFWIRIYSIVMMIVPFLIAFATAGRGPLFGFTMAAFILVFGLEKKRRWYYAIALIGLVVISYVMIVNYFPVMEHRIMGGSDSGRSTIWTNVINGRFTLFGIGIYDDYPHNIFLEFLLDYGVIGLILFLIFFIPLIMSFFRCYYKTHYNEVLWALCLFVLQMTAQQFSLDIFNTGLWAAILLPLGFSWDNSPVHDVELETSF